MNTPSKVDHQKNLFYTLVFTKLHPSYHLNSTQPDHAMWQSPPFKISQPEQDTCHNPPLTKLTSQILPHHHLLHLTHETLTLIFLLSYHHHGSRHPSHQSRRRPPRRITNLQRASTAPLSTLQHHETMLEQPPFAGAAAIAAATSLHETLNAANPSLERESALCATCQAAIGQSKWSTLVNWSKSAVKFWSIL